MFLRLGIRTLTVSRVILPRAFTPLARCNVAIVRGLATQSNTPLRGTPRGIKKESPTTIHEGSEKEISEAFREAKEAATVVVAAPSNEEIKVDALKTKTPIGEAFKLSPKDSNPNGWTDIKKLFRLAYPVRGQLAFAFACLFIASLVSMSLPLVIGKLMDSANQAEGSHNVYGIPLASFYYLMGGVFVVGAIANGLRHTLLKAIGENIVSKLRTRVLKNALMQDAAFSDTNSVGDMISRLSTDSHIVAKAVSQNVSDGLKAALLGTIGIAMMVYVSTQLSLMMAIVLPPLALFGAFYGRKVRLLTKQLQEQFGELTKVAEEQLSAAKTIQSFGQERQAVNLYSSEVRRVFNIGLREAKLSGVFFGSTAFLGNATLLALLAYGNGLVSSGAISFGDLSSFIMYAVYTGSSMVGLSNFYSEIMKGAGAASRVFELLEHKPTIKPTKGLRITDPHTQLGGDIVFDRVRFAYPTRPDVAIFQELSVTIRKGEHVCFVGPSGSGKSTVSALLLRFYDPLSGSISINGLNLRDLNLLTYRRGLGVVQQEPLLFSGTIRENITFGRPHATMDEIRNAARLANCDKFISEFPAGLDTVIGSRGAQLSGGQRQRIALARTLITNPAILILDEATSALDTLSEKAINENLLFRKAHGQTTISIAHRLSTIRNASRIVVLNKVGDVVETGGFEALYGDAKSELNRLLRSNNGELEESEVIKEREEIDMRIEHGSSPTGLS
ncbi:hypothetical protein BABINDRAFT_161354 [Babjeviella inositovora NRRL Y-12698]|uniref:ABC transporter domain-containing protein n=1 Tax=Babjeviella inositovora NRRL Y-12698 TaxID=984486 RepID=A0A1E3QRZ1_9ASCO|nr:uncharacterized protein BABINDRAFT_161354 [Babjeviella inositovora NRRL Y-12698]ODQ80408.1 hypothetical protein BABINDRAFT_161354 [Babjeviella inositovora NRRL Y-12698]